MAVLPAIAFQGVLADPTSGAAVPFTGTCVLAIDNQGRESLHVRAVARCGGAETPVLVLGHIDRVRSFVGREIEAAIECVSMKLGLGQVPATAPELQAA